MLDAEILNEIGHGDGCVGLELSVVEDLMKTYMTRVSIDLWWLLQALLYGWSPSDNLLCALCWIRWDGLGKGCRHLQGKVTVGVGGEGLI